MKQSRAIAWSVLAWIAVGLFWLFATHSYHPTRTLALIVTTALVSAYALAAYVNHGLLIPRFLRRGRWGAYLFSLLLAMGLLTALALAVIRVSYFRLWGPDADPNGAAKHFVIDLAGMAVHLVAAAAVVWIVPRVLASRG
jgi:hypothetical protein